MLLFFVIYTVRRNGLCDNFCQSMPVRNALEAPGASDILDGECLALLFLVVR